MFDVLDKLIFSALERSLDFSLLKDENSPELRKLGHTDLFFLGNRNFNLNAVDFSKQV